jgi:hypothetical protein
VQTSERLERYVDSLVEARKKKGLPRETALDMVKVREALEPPTFKPYLVFLHVQRLAISCSPGFVKLVRQVWGDAWASRWASPPYLPEP